MHPVTKMMLAPLLVACLSLSLFAAHCGYSTDYIATYNGNNLFDDNSVVSVQQVNDPDGCSAPFSLSLFNPVQTSATTDSIQGVRLNLIYGSNCSLTGLDLGLINRLSNDLTGYQVGFVNLVANDLFGRQVGLINQVCGNAFGYQHGIINMVQGHFSGWQNALLFNTAYSIAGAQIGLINQAEIMNGLQLGLINYTDTLSGIQVGLINIQACRPRYSLLPLLNISW